MRTTPEQARRSRGPRRLPRRVIAAGTILIAGSLAATLIAHAASPPSPRPAAISPPSPRPPAGYLLVAQDAHFTALFPRKPLRIQQTAGTTTIIAYLADLPGYAVGIICAPVPPPGRIHLDRAINLAATALPGGQVTSRHRLTYHGQPAEDATITILGEPGQITVVALGTSAYLFEGFGPTTASFTPGYTTLLNTFTPHPHPGTTC